MTTIRLRNPTLRERLQYAVSPSDTFVAPGFGGGGVGLKQPDLTPDDSVERLVEAGWPAEAARADFEACRANYEACNRRRAEAVERLLALDEQRDHERDVALRPYVTATDTSWPLEEAIKEIAWRTDLVDARFDDLFERRYPLTEYIEDLGISSTFSKALGLAEVAICEALANGSLWATGRKELPGGLVERNPVPVPKHFWSRATLCGDVQSVRSQRGETWRMIRVRSADVNRLWPEAAEDQLPDQSGERLIPLSPGPHHVVTGDPKLRRT